MRSCFREQGPLLAASRSVDEGGGRGAPSFGGPYRDFEHVGGIHLTDSILWCDADRKNGLNFLSSALAGDIGKNRRVLATEATERIVARGKGKLDVLTAPYDKPLTVGELKLSLHPSGHMLGGAQLRIEREGRVVVYAGEIWARPSVTALAAVTIPCQAIALPATYGRRPFTFPPREEVLEALRTFIDGTLAARRTPVLLTPPIGIGQELLATLGRAGYKLRVHRQVADVAKIYEALGIAMPAHKRFSSRVARGEVLLLPLILRASVEAQVPDARVALVGPKGIDAGYVHRLGVADAFPLSNVADRADLLQFVQATGAEEVFLTGGYIDELGEDLRDQGLRVHGLLPREQLELFG